MQQGPSIWFLAGLQLVGGAIEQRVQRRDVATTGGVEQLALDAERIDVGLEGSPARKTVLPRDVALRVGEFGLRVGNAELGEVTLGLLAKPRQIRLHDTNLPSLDRPLSAVEGEEVRLCRHTSTGGLETLYADRGPPWRRSLECNTAKRISFSPEMPRPKAEDRTILLDARAMSRALQRMAVEILELAHGTDDLVLVGIQRRGVELADRLAKLIEKDESPSVALPRGALDITLYRDDLGTIGPKPVIGETRIPGDLTDKHAVIVDDVLYTGRTVRAALDELADFGRPRRISLCVLVDRGGRELPIQADIVGKSVKTEAGERVDVLVEELDGRDQVDVVR